jgi:diketogulonate reductase-like aldo/keto reductase
MRPEHPALLYGTAWKEDETERLVRLALEAGFRGIDTANQRKHYHEAGVGAALAGAIASGLVERDDVFLQTKYTFAAGQDHRPPYDPDAPIADQVRQSFNSSLQHLRVDRIDALVLHGPSRRSGLHADDIAAWGAMEALHAEGRTRSLGVSNVQLEQLVKLCDGAKVAPSFVQNRCFASTGWDRDVRAACRERGIVYQGFSLLTANVGVLRDPALAAMARDREVTPAQVVFAFALAVGMLPLTGTTSPEHMRQDLAATQVGLSDDEVRRIERLGE